MSELKSALYISRDLPHSISDFYKTLDELNQAGIHTLHVDRRYRVFHTKEVMVCFRAAGQNIDGFQVDELFGCYDPKWDLCHLKDNNKPQYSGSLIEYINKIEENAKNEAFLENELRKLRTKK